MAIDRVIGIAVLSGKGGVGKSVVALNLALALGNLGIKTLLFDAAGGDLVHLTNSGKATDSQALSSLVMLTPNVGLYNSSISDSYSILNESDIDQFLKEIVESSTGYECVVFDCLTGAGAVSYTLAGLSELPLLVATADPTAIAGTYLLAKALYQDGLGSRCQLLFNEVESVDEAASLKTRFDLLTSQFLQHIFKQCGYIHKDQILANSVLEQNPMLLGNSDCVARTDFLRLGDNISHLERLQFATHESKSQSRT